MISFETEGEGGALFECRLENDGCPLFMGSR